MAVEPVREGGGDKEGKGKPGGPKGDRRMSTGLEKYEQDERCKDASDREPVGKSHGR
jgi:hypothetical protein